MKHSEKSSITFSHVSLLFFLQAKHGTAQIFFVFFKGDYFKTSSVKAGGTIIALPG